MTILSTCSGVKVSMYDSNSSDARIVHSPFGLGGTCVPEIRQKTEYNMTSLKSMVIDSLDRKRMKGGDASKKCNDNIPYKEVKLTTLQAKITTMVTTIQKKWRN